MNRVNRDYRLRGLGFIGPGSVGFGVIYGLGFAGLRLRV